MPFGRLLSRFSRDGEPKASGSRTAAHIDSEDFYRFQSGRWLWNEQEQLQKRYRKFNAAALQDAAAASVGAKRCTSMIKISESGTGNNRVFRLVMDKRKVVIAKIPYHRADSGRLRVSSEVATMDFASNVLGLPVPKVLAWNADEGNPVQTEYILMQEARGTLLSDSWDSLHPDTKAEILVDLAAISGKFQSISFSHIGNLYFAADKIQGAVPAVVGGNLPEKIKAEVPLRYTIGPAVDQSYWEDGRARVTGAQGPWRSAREWLKAIATREMTWLDQYAFDRRQQPLMPAPTGTKASHIDLWRKFDASTEFVTSISQGLLRSTLWHGDIRPSNLFVNKNKITGVIDWEGSWATPLLFTARQPAILLPDFDVVPLTQENAQQLLHTADEAERARVIKSVEWQYLRYAYDHALLQSSPVFKQIENVPLVLTLQQVVLQAEETWKTGDHAIRECLMTIQHHWQEICPGKACPFECGPQDAAHRAAGQEVFMELVSLLTVSRGVMHGEGFVKTADDYNAMKAFFTKLRQIKLQQPQSAARDEVLGALAWVVEG